MIELNEHIPGPPPPPDPRKVIKGAALVLVVLFVVWRLSVSGAELELNITEHMTLKLYLAPPDEDEPCQDPNE